MDSCSIKKQFDLIASQYDAGRRCFIPCFDDYYVRSLSLLKHIRPEANSIIDLGAGTGLLTKEVYLLYPEARFTLVDLSDDMLSVARQRFAGLHNFTYLAADYSVSLPSVSPDIICSALSIHHLENEQKAALYSSVYEALDHGGVFINLDQFRDDSPIVNAAYDEWWMDYIDHSGITPEAKERWLERKKLDRENSVTETLALLRKAGFGHVECIYEFMKFAVVVAVK